MSYFGYKSMDGQAVPDLRKALSEPLTKAALGYVEVLGKRQDEMMNLQREANKSVRESPYGLAPSAQQAALGIATQGAEKLRSLEKDYKSGSISYKEYKFTRQNVVDDVTSAYDLLSKSSELSKGLYQSIAEGKEDPMAIYVADNLQKSSDLSKLTPSFTQEGLLVYNNADGSPMTQRQATQMQTFRLGKQDYLSGVDNFMKSIGEVMALGKGKMESTLSVKNNPAFAEARKDFVESQLSNPFVVQSIVAQNASNINDVYTTDENEAKANPKKILIRPGTNALGFEPVVTEEVKQEARKILEQQIDQRIESKFTLKPDSQVYGGKPDKPTEGENKKAIVKEQIYNAFTTTDPKARKAFINAVSNTKSGIQNARFDKNKEGGTSFFYDQVKMGPYGQSAGTVRMEVPLDDIDNFAQAIAPIFDVTIGTGELGGPVMAGSATEPVKAGETIKATIPTSSTVIPGAKVTGKSAAFSSSEIDAGASAFVENLKEKGFDVTAEVEGGKGSFTIKFDDGSTKSIPVTTEGGFYQGSRVQAAMDKVLAELKKKYK
jgi:hypothetical protein